MPSTSFIGSIWRESDWARCSPSSGRSPSSERSRWQPPHGCSAIDWRDRELARGDRASTSPAVELVPKPERAAQYEALAAPIPSHLAALVRHLEKQERPA